MYNELGATFNTVVSGRVFPKEIYTEPAEVYWGNTRLFPKETNPEPDRVDCGKSQAMILIFIEIDTKESQTDFNISTQEWDFYRRIFHMNRTIIF